MTECSFVSNDAESIWCSNDSHQMILAQAHAKAICKFLGKDYKEGGFIKTAIKLNGSLISSGLLINDVSYAPVRALAEALGCVVTWDQATRTVNIQKP